MFICVFLYLIVCMPACIDSFICIVVTSVMFVTCLSLYARIANLYMHVVLLCSCKVITKSKIVHFRFSSAMTHSVPFPTLFPLGSSGPGVF